MKRRVQVLLELWVLGKCELRFWRSWWRGNCGVLEENHFCKRALCARKKKDEGFWLRFNGLREAVISKVIKHVSFCFKLQVYFILIQKIKSKSSKFRDFDYHFQGIVWSKYILKSIGHNLRKQYQSSITSNNPWNQKP